VPTHSSATAGTHIETAESSTEIRVDGNAVTNVDCQSQTETAAMHALRPAGTKALWHLLKHASQIAPLTTSCSCNLA
jgi:hypothetical protein